MGCMTPNVIPTMDIGTDERLNFAPRSVSRFMRFGPFQIDQQRQEVTKNGSRLKVQGKVYQVLVALLDKPGEVVTREELRQRLWPAESHVNYDANVNTTVNKLRQALGDSSDHPVFIETIPRKGYCFLMYPELSDQPVAPSAAQDKVAAPQSANHTGETTNADPASSSPWITMGVIGLILAGMLLGAGIAKLWMSHLTPDWPLF